MVTGRSRESLDQAYVYRSVSTPAQREDGLDLSLWWGGLGDESAESLATTTPTTRVHNETRHKHEQSLETESRKRMITLRYEYYKQRRHEFLLAGPRNRHAAHNHPLQDMRALHQVQLARQSGMR
jgi:hypothetical protein